MVRPFTSTTWPLLWRRLTPLYDDGEAKAIVRTVLECRFGMSSADIYTDGISRLTPDHQCELETIMQRLEKGEPVQYVLGQAMFLDRRFAVGKGVLIPRPETEELCQWIIDDHEGGDGADILDIGTGTGCIALTLAADVAEAAVTVWDLSAAALICCEENARRLGLTVDIVQQDALTPPDDTDRWDIIVSNPPYVCDSERDAMHPNVTEHEPHEALFVSDDDPTVYYRAISRYAVKALKSDGTLYFEINPQFATEVLTEVMCAGFHDILTRHDSNGKIRFIKATRDIKRK